MNRLLLIDFLGSVPLGTTVEEAIDELKAAIEELDRVSSASDGGRVSR